MASWLNGIAIVAFLLIEIFWHVKQKKGVTNISSLLLGFFIYNVPFWLLALSMYFNPHPAGWMGVIMRLVFLLILIPVNLWLHYHGDKGGNSVGMAIVFFLLVSIPLILVM